MYKFTKSNLFGTSHFNFNKGFTLIELLVVIAIIGVLSSIVLASLNSSRAKGNDAKTKAQLASLRSVAELYLALNNNSYTASVMAAPANPCTGAMFTDAASKMNDYTGTVSAWPSTVLLSCQATASAYAVSVSLLSVSGAWCIDSLGFSMKIASNLVSGDVTCN